MGEARKGGQVQGRHPGGGRFRASPRRQQTLAGHPRQLQLPGQLASRPRTRAALETARPCPPPSVLPMAGNIIEKQLCTVMGLFCDYWVKK